MGWFDMASHLQAVSKGSRLTGVMTMMMCRVGGCGQMGYRTCDSCNRYTCEDHLLTNDSYPTRRICVMCSDLLTAPKQRPDRNVGKWVFGILIALFPCVAIIAVASYVDSNSEPPPGFVIGD